MDPALDKASSYPQPPEPTPGAPPPGVAARDYRLRVLKEPRGFLRAIEFVLAVCMFATTAGYATYYTFTVSCAPGHVYEQKVEYPFRLESGPLPSICNDTLKRYASSDPSSSAQFFVAIGVLAMLYTIGALLWYIIYEARYPDKEIHFIVDLIVTGVFVLLFFISSCAWAAGLNDVKHWTNFDNLAQNELVYKSTCDNPAFTCQAERRANYASLNVSVIFGFLNTVVWGGNLWFIYKETSWFQQRQQQNQPAAAKPPLPTDPNTV
ncbi:synaptophysin-like [Diadema antillarum]|uniref:synaptophysin-like n=1 Tax=Diadema antillarum TaxID=105358 RepID=UPI003A8A207D